MRYSNRVDWIAGDTAQAWDIHYQALADAQNDPEVIVLSVGDPDFATPSSIIEAAYQSLKDGDTHYTPILGLSSLREAIRDYFQLSGARHVDTPSIAVLAGAQNALFSASLCTLSPGDEVITLDPAYVTYEAAIGVSGARLVRVASSSARGFRPDLDAVREAITPATRAILFSNPNNPSGMAVNATEMQGMIDLAKTHDLWLWSDEVYATIMFDGDHVSLSQFPDAQERSIIIGSLSKSHAMTGWRVGWLVAPPELIRHVENLALCMLYGLPGFIQRAAEHALRSAAQSSSEMRDAYLKRRNLVVTMLEAIADLNVIAPQAGMFILVDIRKTKLSSEQFMRRLYSEHKVSVLDGAVFSPQLDGFVRLSFTNGLTQLTEACHRIKQFVQSL